LQVHINPIHVTFRDGETMYPKKVTINFILFPADEKYQEIMETIGEYSGYMSPLIELDANGTLVYSEFSSVDEIFKGSLGSLPVKAYAYGWKDGRLGDPFVYVMVTTQIPILRLTEWVSFSCSVPSLGLEGQVLVRVYRKFKRSFWGRLRRIIGDKTYELEGRN